MKTKSSAHYRRFLLATAILLSLAVITLVAILVGIAFNGLELTSDKVIAYIILEIVWTVVLCALVICSVRVGARYRNEAQSGSVDMFQALSGQYKAVFLVNFSRDTVKELYNRSEYFDIIKEDENGKVSISSFINNVADKVVCDENREEFIKELNREQLIRKLNDKKYYSYIFNGKIGDSIKFYQMKIVYAPGSSDELIFGFADVDDEIRADEEKKRITKEALKDAKAANNAKNTFLTNMSHDIRTPLNAIMGFAEVARWHVDNKEEVSEYIEKINVASNQMLYLVNNVLDMSMLEGGTMKLNKSPVNIQSIVQEVEIVTRTVTGEHNQSLNVNYYNLEHDSVIADRVAISRVLMNILGNASQYTPDGGEISLSIKELTNTASDATYAFIIEDNGIGMDSDFVPHSYEMFSRERSSTESGIPGVGLGLAISKNIVDAMGGSIEISSVKKEGTQVVVVLSLELSKDAVEFTEIRDSRKVNPVLSEEKPKILIAEDNSLNREILGNILDSFGFAVDEAFNGKEAVEKFEASKPGTYRMILMDIRMPVMDGYEATRTIRGLERIDAVQIPIIAVTANAFAQDVADAKQAGMNNHIAKPVKVTQIKEMLATYI